MRKNAYQKRTEPHWSKPNTKMQWFERRDASGIMQAGIIPFHTDQYGFNPGKLIEIYLSRLHPANERLLQRPMPISSKFGLHRPKSKLAPWYYTHPVGKNMICTLIPAHASRAIDRSWGCNYGNC